MENLTNRKGESSDVKSTDSAIELWPWLSTAEPSAIPPAAIVPSANPN